MKTLKSVMTLVICSQFLAACSGGNFHSDGTVNKVDSSQDLGTGDGGGGNAINFKMLESHLIDPNNLQVVKDKVRPFMDKISRDSNTNIFASKNWYLAPINLKTLPKEVIGVEFTKGNLQQVAIQTKNAVWINSEIFNKMAEEEQARLIVHELMMGLYMYRFYGIEEICKIAEKQGQKGCSGNQSLNAINKADFFAPEKLRRLEAKDYEVIRAMTAWFFMEGIEITPESFNRKAIELGLFDKRFSSSSSGNENENESVSIEFSSFVQALKASQLSGSLSEDCHTLNLKTSFKCKVSIEVVSSEDQPNVEKLEIKVIDEVSARILQKSVVKAYENKMLVTTRNDGTLIATSVDEVLFSKEAEGVIGSVANFVLTNQDNQLRLSKLIMVPFVNVGSVEVTKDGVSCQQVRVERLHPSDKQSDSVIITSKEETVGIDSLLGLIHFKGLNQDCKSK